MNEDDHAWILSLCLVEGLSQKPKLHYMLLFFCIFHLLIYKLFEAASTAMAGTDNDVQWLVIQKDNEKQD